MGVRTLLKSVRKSVKQRSETTEAFDKAFRRSRAEEAKLVRISRLKEAARRGREAGKKAAQGKGKVSADGLIEQITEVARGPERRPTKRRGRARLSTRARKARRRRPPPERDEDFTLSFG